MFQGSNRIDHSFRGIVGWHTPSRSSTAVGSCAWERIHRYSDRDRARLGSHDAAVVEVRSSRGTVSFSRSPAPIPGGYLLTPRVTCVAVDTPIKPKQLYCGVFPHGQRQPAAACTAASLRTRTLTVPASIYRGVAGLRRCAGDGPAADAAVSQFQDEVSLAVGTSGRIINSSWLMSKRC